MKQKLFFGLVAVVLVVGLSVPAAAQVSTRTGSIFGKVLDDSKAPLPGVTSTLECDSIVRPQTAVTGPTGTFRFSQIPPGTCSVTFTLEGFTEIRQEEVRVTIGGEVQLAITMKPTLAEEFVVVAETPVVDSKRTGNDTTFTSEYLTEVPSGRDPWVIIEQTPGVDNDRINVAGSESGQQTGFFARGNTDDANGWRYDGVAAEDNASLGASTYYDFDSFEEIQIISGGADASIGKSGVQVNIVTKRGTNNWEANASAYFVNDSLQATNTPDELVAAGVERSNRIDQVYEYGFDIGGPVVKDRFFVWGAYRKNKVDLFTRTGLSDKTELINWNFKANANLNDANEVQFGYWSSDKNKSGRAFDPANQRAETLWEQGSPGTIFEPYISAQHTWIPNDRTILTSRYGHFAIAFGLEPSGGNQVPMILLTAIPSWEETSFFITPIERPTNSFNMDLNWFKEGWGGGDHEFKFGFEYAHNTAHTFSSYGNGQLIQDYYQTVSGGPLTSGYVLAQYFIDGRVAYDTFSAYVTDTIRMDRLTLNLGLRFDTANGENRASSIPSVPGFEAFLPPISYSGSDGTDAFTYVSPRLGATYDITGDGKTIVRGNYARYYTGYGPGFDTYSNPTYTYIGAGFYYANLNGDRRLQPGEITGGPFFYGGLAAGGFDIAAFEANKAYDPDLHETPIDEVILGVEREVIKDFSLGVNYTYRKYNGIVSAIPTVGPGGRQITDTDFTPQAPLQVVTSQGTFSVPYSTLNFANNGTSVLTNVDGYDTSYNGVDIVARKRMSNNFMLNSSVTIQRQKASYANDGESFWIVAPDGLGTAFDTFGDPVAVPATGDGEAYAFASAGSGKTGVFPYAEWTFRLSGVYQLPYEMTAGAFVRYQQGYPNPFFVTVSDRTLSAFYATPNKAILIEPIGTTRYDNIFTLDLNFRKTFHIGDAGRITASLDLFNVTNANQVVQRQRRTTTSSFFSIQENLSPRALRLGVRYSF